MDRSTGENQRAAVLETLQVIPELERLAKAFDFNVRCTCTDRYLAYFRTENGLCHSGFLSNFVLSHFPCDVHRAAACLKHTLRPCDQEISGIVNTGLLMSADRGIVAKLKDSFATLRRITVNLRMTTKSSD